MKKTVLLILIQILILCSLSAQTEAGTGRLKALGFSLPPDRTAPPPLSAYLREEKVELTLQKRVTLLYFWSGLIPSSLTDLTLLERIRKQAEDAGVLIIPVNLNEDRQPALDGAEKAGYGGSIYLYPDPASLNPYILRSVPSAYILDKRGDLAASVQGNTAWDHPDVMRTLKELAAERP